MAYPNNLYVKYWYSNADLFVDSSHHSEDVGNVPIRCWQICFLLWCLFQQNRILVLDTSTGIVPHMYTVRPFFFINLYTVVPSLLGRYGTPRATVELYKNRHVNLKSRIRILVLVNNILIRFYIRNIANWLQSVTVFAHRPWRSKGMPFFYHMIINRPTPTIGPCAGGPGYAQDCGLRDCPLDDWGNLSSRGDVRYRTQIRVTQLFFK